MMRSKEGLATSDGAKPGRNEAEPRESKSRLSWPVINFCLDVALGANFLVLAWITGVLRFLFPLATQARDWRVLGASYDAWAGAQFGALAVLALGIVVHVMFHWSWVCGIVSSRLTKWSGRAVRWDEGTQTLLGVGLLIVLLNVLGFTFAVAALNVVRP
jgi:hypothetical protein